jgi:hypothetical protein
LRFTTSCIGAYAPNAVRELIGKSLKLELELGGALQLGTSGGQSRNDFGLGHRSSEGCRLWTASDDVAEAA